MNTSITNLTNGILYNFEIAAVNKFGTSKWTANPRQIIPAGIPLPPLITNVTISNPGSEALVHVYWNNAESNGRPVLFYKVYARAYYSLALLHLVEQERKVRDCCNVTLESFHIGQSYEICISTVTTFGSSQMQCWQKGKIIPYPSLRPGKPERIFAHAGDQNVSLYFAPSPSNGMPVSQYVIALKENRNLNVTINLPVVTIGGCICKSTWEYGENFFHGCSNPIDGLFDLCFAAGQSGGVDSVCRR